MFQWFHGFVPILGVFTTIPDKLEKLDFYPKICINENIDLVFLLCNLSPLNSIQRGMPKLQLQSIGCSQMMSCAEGGGGGGVTKK